MVPRSRCSAVRGSEAGVGFGAWESLDYAEGLTRYELDLDLRPGKAAESEGFVPRKEKIREGPTTSGLEACLSPRLSLFLLLYTLKSSGFCQATGLKSTAAPTPHLPLTSCFERKNKALLVKVLESQLFFF